MFPEYLSSLLPVLSVNKGDVLSAFNIKNINDGLILYKKYLDEMESNKIIYDDILDIKYEELVIDSKRVVKEIFDYLGINISGNQYQEIEKKIERLKKAD